MVLPSGSELQEFFVRLALERGFNFVDAGDARADAIHFALVLAADDFGEKPLDHRTRVAKGLRASLAIRNGVVGSFENNLEGFME